MAAETVSFPGSAIAFLRELAANNQREWFQARKQVFEQQVREPFVRLATAVNDSLGSFAPDYRVLDPSRAISRIHRDTRFSADKSPYHTHLSIVFPREGGEKQEVAGFFLGLRPEGVDLLGGAYVPGPPQLEALRRACVERTAELRRLIAEPALVAAMGPLQGERLKRLPRGFEQAEEERDLVTLKQAYFRTALGPAQGDGSGLVSEIARRFELMTPFVRFLDQALAPARTGVPQR